MKTFQEKECRRYLFRFIFFLYQMWPTVNLSVYLCRIINEVRHNSDNKSINYEICDNIKVILAKNALSEYCQVETLYLLLALSEFREDRPLSEDQLRKYFNLPESNSADDEEIELRLNYFAIISLLFYMKNKKEYKGLRKEVSDFIEKRLSVDREIIQESAELTFLLFDSLSCPYLTDKTKMELLNKVGILGKKAKAIIELEDKQGNTQQWFTDWSNFKYDEALEKQKNHPSY